MGDAQNGWFIRSMFKHFVFAPRPKATLGPSKCHARSFALLKGIGFARCEGFFICMAVKCLRVTRLDITSASLGKNWWARKESNVERSKSLLSSDWAGLKVVWILRIVRLTVPSGNQTWQLKIPYAVKRCFTGKTFITNGGFSIAMFDCRRVYRLWCGMPNKMCHLLAFFFRVPRL